MKFASKISALNMLDRIDKRVREDWSRLPIEIVEIRFIIAGFKRLVTGDFKWRISIRIT